MPIDPFPPERPTPVMAADRRYLAEIKRSPPPKKSPKILAMPPLTHVNYRSNSPAISKPPGQRTRIRVRDNAGRITSSGGELVVHPILDRLRQAGWTVGVTERALALPRAVAQRYPKIPDEAAVILSQLDVCVSPDEKSWVLGASDYAGTGGAAFRWNEWEELSLDAAGEHDKWRDAIRRFWDAHFPFFMSVATGYEYAAIRVVDPGFGGVVQGREPEFEETTTVAEDLVAFLGQLARSPN